MGRFAAILGVLGLGVLMGACGWQGLQGGRESLAPPAPAALRVATLNVHYILADRATGAWSLADWEARRDALDAAFKAIDADIFAFQEMETFEGGDDDTVNLARSFLLDRNPGHAAAAVGDWQSFPSTQPIFYRRDRLRLLDQGWFFFSDTPEVIYSRTFDGSWPAFASWAEFEDRFSNRRFRVMNLHFEYRSRSNRHLSAALVRDRLAPWIDAGMPVFVLGDLNDLQGSRTMDLIAETGLRFLPVRGATWHMNRGLNLLPAIDHIGHAGPMLPHAATLVLRQRFDGRWPSDHYPVVADYRWP